MLFKASENDFGTALKSFNMCKLDESALVPPTPPLAPPCVPQMPLPPFHAHPALNPCTPAFMPPSTSRGALGGFNRSQPKQQAHVICQPMTHKSCSVRISHVGTWPVFYVQIIGQTLAQLKVISNAIDGKLHSMRQTTMKLKVNFGLIMF